jgi:glycolate oxidase iron-sulfur subunit
MAEGQQATAKTRDHLDRCLTCKNCETTCPSGVQYGRLLEIGRQWVQIQNPARPLAQRVLRWALKEGLTRSYIFNPAIQIGRILRPFLPTVLQKKIPLSNSSSSKKIPNSSSFQETMLFLEGCVQPGMLPNINHATQRVFAKLHIQLIAPPSAGCCGAIRLHLSDEPGALQDMRRNIDAWWPLIQQEQIQTIVMNAAGCGVTVKDYGHLLHNDLAYAKKAHIISAMTKDISEILPKYAEQLTAQITPNKSASVIYHPPCTLQHGQKIRGNVEELLGKIGIQVNLCADSHLCCGSAGTYSILQANLSNQLRDQKVSQLVQAGSTYQATEIVSGNVGCISHLQNDSLPVRHWIEIIDDLLLA